MEKTDNSLYNWAKKEVNTYLKALGEEDKQAIKEEYEIDNPAGALDTVLKAFRVLINGCTSAGEWHYMADNIQTLTSLMVLSPITEDDEWLDISSSYGKVIEDDPDVVKVFQNQRCTSLFKLVNEDGTVDYHDNQRAYCIDLNDNVPSPQKSSFVNQIIDAMIPITIPYFPGQCLVRMETYKYDESNKDIDFDTIKLLNYEENDRIVELDQYFILSDNSEDGEFIDCDEEEFERRKAEVMNRIFPDEEDDEEEKLEDKVD